MDTTSARFAVAVFAYGVSGLFEAIPLPCPLPERGVLGVRAHIRPLLLARQRYPAYHVVEVRPGSFTADPIR